MSTAAQREAAARVLRRQHLGDDAEIAHCSDYESAVYRARADEIIAAYEAAAPTRPTHDEIARVAQELFATPMGLMGRLADQPQQTQESYLAQAREAIRAVRSLSCPELSSAPPKDPAP